MIDVINDIRDITSEIMPKNTVIVTNYIKAWKKINSDKYKKIMVSISGGSDSDIVLDICYRCDKDNKCSYVWFDTGLEYQATKGHIEYLEKKYGIDIIRQKAIKSIPSCCKSYGQPFLSKYVSEMIERLQRNKFDFKDGEYEELVEKYPKCKSAIAWWTNKRETMSSGFSRFNISYNKHLKEFLIQNPPEFLISNKCCKYAKKEASKQYVKDSGCDLVITGVRKAEGGARAGRYKTCFYDGWEYSTYMPIFWYKDQDKLEYEEYFMVEHSKCYTEYGLKRTGCACCPYGFYGGLKRELKTAKQNEPKLHKAVCNVFHDSYMYTIEFEKFKKEILRKG